MMYKIVSTTKFKRDLKIALKRGYNISLLNEVIENLSNGEPLLERYHDHLLIGNYVECRECHITPDWRLIYEISDSELILYLTRTGTHSDLF